MIRLLLTAGVCIAEAGAAVADGWTWAEVQDMMESSSNDDPLPLRRSVWCCAARPLWENSTSSISKMSDEGPSTESPEFVTLRRRDDGTGAPPNPPTAAEKSLKKTASEDELKTTGAAAAAAAAASCMMAISDSPCHAVSLRSFTSTR